MSSSIQRHARKLLRNSHTPWVYHGASTINPLINNINFSATSCSSTWYGTICSRTFSTSSSSSSSSTASATNQLNLQTLTTHFTPQDAEHISRIILRRHSVGKFNSSKLISEDIIQNILALTLRSPTSFNSSPYRIIIIDDDKLKQELSLCMLGRGNSLRIIQAPITAVFLADCDNTQVMNNIIELEHSKGKPTQYLRNLSLNPINFAGGGGVCQEGPLASIRARIFTLGSNIVPSPTPNSTEGWAFKNTSLAAMTYMLAATGYGIGTHPMEGFDGKRIRQLLKVPNRYSIPLIIPTGYEIQENENNPNHIRNHRINSEKIFYRNSLHHSYPNVPNV